MVVYTHRVKNVYHHTLERWITKRTTLASRQAQDVTQPHSVHLSRGTSTFGASEAPVTPFSSFISPACGCRSIRACYRYRGELQSMVSAATIEHEPASRACRLDATWSQRFPRHPAFNFERIPLIIGSKTARAHIL